MTVVGLLGASGYTGRLVARALDRRGVGFIASGRDLERVRTAVAGLDHVVGVRRVDVNRRDTLAALCSEVDVLATTVGPYVELGRPVLEAAVNAPCHYLDASGEQPFLRWAFESQGASAAGAGVSAVVGCGFWGVMGDLLAHLAAAAVPGAVEMHVAYIARGAGISASRGTRTTISRLLGHRGYAFVDGQLVAEGPAEARRHAWFPRPVGPRYSAGIPGLEPLTVPRHVPDIRVVRSYIALPGPLLDLMQLVGNLARWKPVRTVASRLLHAGPEDPGEARRGSMRWACVAEAQGESGNAARAWAYGRDPYGVTAETMAAVADRLGAGLGGTTQGGGRPRTPEGVVAPAEAVDAAGLLDELADLTGLRWSVRTPTSDDAPTASPSPGGAGRSWLAPGRAAGPAGGPIQDHRGDNSGAGRA